DEYIAWSPAIPRGSLICIFFFFQAEDGIRDFHVTGVQTCALPISIHLLRSPSPARDRLQTNAPTDRRRDDAQLRHQPIELIRERSEERRVGKECRSRY